MVRFLQFIALLFVVRYVFRAVARWLGGTEPQQVRGERDAMKPIYRGQMVRDPVCGVFVPRERAIEDRRDSDVRHFCSEACRQTYKAARVGVT